VMPLINSHPFFAASALMKVVMVAFGVKLAWNTKRFDRQYAESNALLLTCYTVAISGALICFTQVSGEAQAEPSDASLVCGEGRRANKRPAANEVCAQTALWSLCTSLALFGSSRSALSDRLKLRFERCARGTRAETTGA